MNTKLTILAALSVLTLGLAACTPEQRLSGKHPGRYDSTETSTDAKGTTTEQQSSSEVTVDENGNKKEVIKTKTTRDPRGLWNKTTTSKTSQTIEDNQ